LSGLKIKHDRIVYTFWEVLEAIGGMGELILWFFGLLVVPYTQLSFDFDAIEKFYTYVPHDKYDNSDCINEGGDTHKKIKLTNSDFCYAFMKELFGCGCCCKPTLNRKRVDHILEKGKRNIE
jgi:hypothetical protein